MKEIIKKIEERKGFVMLFAVTISAILLAIALGVANIALKEVKFGSSAIDANNAFFAADEGAEVVLYYDKPPTSTYVLVGAETTHIWNFPFTNEGSDGKSCALVRMTKTAIASPPSIQTSIISKGYNVGGDGSCASTASNLVERELDVNY